MEAGAAQTRVAGTGGGKAAVAEVALVLLQAMRLAKTIMATAGRTRRRAENVKIEGTIYGCQAYFPFAAFRNS